MLVGGTNTKFDFEDHKCIAISEVRVGTISGCGYAYSRRSGRWADPDTWQNRTVPKSDDNVRIVDGHIVYTGATAQSFGARAYGQGADNLRGNQSQSGQDQYDDNYWLVGPNETGLTDNRILGTNIIQLANSVTIDDGALIISQLDNVANMFPNNRPTADNAGANDLQTYVLEFGPIINNATPAGTKFIAKYDASQSDARRAERMLFQRDSSVKWAAQIRGLFIIRKDDSTSANGAVTTPNVQSVLGQSTTTH